MKTLSPLVCAVALLSGCATNPFARFYQNYTNEMPVTTQQRLLPAAPQPRIISAAPQNHKDESRRLEEKNFICIGFSGFIDVAPTQSQLVEQAKKVGADVVIYTSEYSHAEQGTAPLFTYQPEQIHKTQHSGTVNVYGSGGRASGTYSGTSTTRTPATFRTDYIPYQQQVYKHGASYWRRMKPAIFGAHLSEIPEDLRSSLQRNTGAFVTLVMLDSSAFKANIMRGDIIIQLADKPIVTVQEFIALLPSYAGQKVTVRVIRGAKTIDVEVQLGQSL